MQKRAVLLAAFFWAVCLSGLARADGEQWLQYRSSDEPWPEAGFPLSLVRLEVSNSPPDGVALPKFEGDRQVFAKWNTPMAKSGFIWLALDGSKGAHTFSRLYVDSNCDGSLAGETPVTGTNSPADRHGTFPRVKVVFDTADGPVTYEFSLAYSEQKGGALICRVFPICWYEGTVKVGGKEYRVVLADSNCNGTFNDSSLDPNQADQVIVRSPYADFRTAGKYIQLVDQLSNTELYSLEVARDGAYVKITPSPKPPVGTLRVAPDVDHVGLLGENGLLFFDVRAAAAQAPAGKYVVYSWRIERKASNGALWLLSASYGQKAAAFEIAEGGETSLDVGEPLVASLEEVEGSQYVFSASLGGRLGESVRMSVGGALPDPPKLVVKNADGSYQKSFSFQYG